MCTKICVLGLLLNLGRHTLPTLDSCLSLSMVGTSLITLCPQVLTSPFYSALIISRVQDTPLSLKPYSWPTPSTVPIHQGFTNYYPRILVGSIIAYLIVLHFSWPDLHQLNIVQFWGIYSFKLCFERYNLHKFYFIKSFKFIYEKYAILSYFWKIVFVCEIGNTILHTLTKHY